MSDFNRAFKSEIRAMRAMYFVFYWCHRLAWQLMVKGFLRCESYGCSDSTSLVATRKHTSVINPQLTIHFLHHIGSELRKMWEHLDEMNEDQPKKYRLIRMPPPHFKHSFLSTLGWFKNQPLKKAKRIQPRLEEVTA